MSMRHPLLVALAAGVFVSAASSQPLGPVGPAAQAHYRPNPLAGLRYDKPFFVDAQGAAIPTDPAFPSGESVLGYQIGLRAATHAEIERCMKAWDGKGPGGQARTRLFEHGETWGGRRLYHMVITSPANLARLDEIRAGHARLADQRGVSKAEAERLAASLPAVAWMAYSIHGDETSGADAALALAHHLASATDDATAQLLENVVVIIDPLMNPDGRDRFLKMIAEARAANPNVDDQSLVHSGYWPYGRTNHYQFDMNRDWIFGVTPETRGRIRAVREWNPQLFVDAHEMDSQDTFLFSPPREPYNTRFAARLLHWQTKLAADQAAAFDRYGWRYYTGEWNEGWYPGYSDSWASFRGAIGMLYEQARLAEDGVRKADGGIVTYRESVHHQAVGSLANLTTLLRNKAEIMSSYAEERRAPLGDDFPDAGAVFAFPPTGNTEREASFLGLLSLQGIEASRAEEAFRADGKDRLGNPVAGREFPKGTLLVSLRQPEARLAATLLEFDPRFTREFLEVERRELLRLGRSKLYDTTAWSLPMLYDVPTYRLEKPTLPATAPAAAPEPAARPGPAPAIADSPVGWLLPGASDGTVAAAARLMERGVQTRVASKAATLGDLRVARGSVIVTRVDNPTFTGDLRETLGGIGAETGVTAVALATGLGAGNENPDLGGEHFPLLQRPRVAIVSRGLTDPNNAGEAWHMVDQRLGMRATVIDAQNLGGIDLRRYNVLILPNTWDSSATQSALPQIAAWVRSGGTLIAVGNAASALASGPAEHGAGGGGPTFGYSSPGSGAGPAKEGSLSSVRTLPDVLDKLDEYDIAVQREFAGRHATVDPDKVFDPAVATDLSYPWEGAAKRPDKDELKKQDQWNTLFMPTGAILAARADDRHWLTFGIDTSAEPLPVLYTGDAVLMAKSVGQAPIRFGHYAPAPLPTEKSKDIEKAQDRARADGMADDKPVSKGDKAEKSDKPEKPSRPLAGWASLPEGQQMRLRMAGLLWPEAGVRLANSAFVTREGVGNGQVILFASSPTFRGATVGTARVFGNAVVFGPGLGARAPIQP